MQPLGKDVREFLALLNKHQVHFMIVGGFAVAAHGLPRYTKDLDVWLDTSPENAERMLRVLEDFGFGSLGITASDLVTPDLVIQLGYEPNRIDLLTGLTGVRFAEAYPQHITATLDGIALPIIDRASLARNKRAFGRPLDIVDAEELEK